MFDGYQSGNQQQVLRQVYAIWNVMQRLGLKYSDITQTSSESKTIYSQYVRFLDESVRNTQANCVDGSVFFASILRRINIKPYLVIIPGHCFLRFDLNANGSSFAALETTMMGQVNLEKYKEKKTVLAELFGGGKETKQDVSIKTFNAALDVGTERYNQYADKFGKDPSCQLIDIEMARNKIGIKPIPSGTSQ